MYALHQSDSSGGDWYCSYCQYGNLAWCFLQGCYSLASIEAAMPCSRHHLLPACQRLLEPLLTYWSIAQLLHSFRLSHCGPMCNRDRLLQNLQCNCHETCAHAKCNVCAFRRIWSRFCGSWWLYMQKSLSAVAAKGKRSASQNTLAPNRLTMMACKACPCSYSRGPLRVLACIVSACKLASPSPVAAFLMLCRCNIVDINPLLQTCKANAMQHGCDCQLM